MKLPRESLSYTGNLELRFFLMTTDTAKVQ